MEQNHLSTIGGERGCPSHPGHNFFRAFSAGICKDSSKVMRKHLLATEKSTFILQLRVVAWQTRGAIQIQLCAEKLGRQPAWCNRPSSLAAA